MDCFGLYKNCRLCPRACGVDRNKTTGYCGEGAPLRLAFAGLHSGEEPSLIGEYGSGTIFVCGCNLGCVFCQNWQVSKGREGERPGRAVSTEEFAQMCLALQNSGAENINIVTGSHAAPAIAQGLTAAKAAGLHIPVLWNSAAYESLASLELLENCVDIWLPDLKTLDSALAARFCNAPDYPQTAMDAINWMIARPGSASKNVIIRHLILPGLLESTRSVTRWFAENAAGKARFSLMSQYTPIPSEAGRKGPGRYLTMREYDTVIGLLGEYGIEDGFCQEYVTGNDWLPDFRRANPFSSKLSKPLWHYGSGL